MTVPRGWTAKATHADWIRIIVIGVFGLTAPHLLDVFGQQHTDSLNGAILVGLEPMTILILARLFLGERLVLKQIAGIDSAILDGALVVSHGDLDSTLTIKNSI